MAEPKDTPSNPDQILEESAIEQQLENVESPYADALWRAFNELQDIQRQQHELTVRTSRLKQTINALFPIVYPTDQEDINSLSLANAIRLVVGGTDNKMTAKEIRIHVQEITGKYHMFTLVGMKATLSLTCFAFFF